MKQEQLIIKYQIKKVSNLNHIKKEKINNRWRTVYLFNNDLAYTTQTYNISKFPLPTNFEVKLHFNSVDWVRTGITFNKDIIKDQYDNH